MALVKITCSRCGGTGKYSFNLIRGTVCFGCNGAGSVIVDADKKAKADKAKAKREAERKATAAQRAELARIVWDELNAELGPFTDDEKGSYACVCACQRKYGKTPGDIVQERLSKINLK